MAIIIDGTQLVFLLVTYLLQNFEFGLYFLTFISIFDVFYKVFLIYKVRYGYQNMDQQKFCLYNIIFLRIDYQHRLNRHKNQLKNSRSYSKISQSKYDYIGPIKVNRTHFILFSYIL